MMVGVGVFVFELVIVAVVAVVAGKASEQSLAE